MAASAQVTLSGLGLIEDNASEYRFGTSSIVDGSASTGPDVGYALRCEPGAIHRQRRGVSERAAEQRDVRGDHGQKRGRGERALEPGVERHRGAGLVGHPGRCGRGLGQCRPGDHPARQRAVHGERCAAALCRQRRHPAHGPAQSQRGGQRREQRHAGGARLRQRGLRPADARCQRPAAAASRTHAERLQRERRRPCSCLAALWWRPTRATSWPGPM